MNDLKAPSPVSIQTESIKKIALQALDDLKAENVKVLDVRQHASFTDVMIFASGKSTRHVKSIASEVVEAAKQANLPPIGVEGDDVGEWVLVDLGDVVVHVMHPDTRLFYDLEKLWTGEQADAEQAQIS